MTRRRVDDGVVTCFTRVHLRFTVIRGEVTREHFGFGMASRTFETAAWAESTNVAFDSALRNILLSFDVIQVALEQPADRIDAVPNFEILTETESDSDSSSSDEDVVD